MAMFGRESQAKLERAESFRVWAQGKSPYALISPMLGVMSLVDAVTMVIGVVLGVAAVLTGLRGFGDLREKPHLSGGRLCVTGIGLGCCGLLASTAVWFVLRG